MTLDQGIGPVEIDGSLDVAAVVGGEEWCAVAFGHFYQTLLDTLDVNGHRVHRSGDDHRLGVAIDEEMVGRYT